MNCTELTHHTLIDVLIFWQIESQRRKNRQRYSEDKASHRKGPQRTRHVRSRQDMRGISVLSFSERGVVLWGELRECGDEAGDGVCARAVVVRAELVRALTMPDADKARHPRSNRQRGRTPAPKRIGQAIRGKRRQTKTSWSRQ